MRIYRDVPLAKYSTMRLGGHAAYLAFAKDKHELVNALEWANNHKLRSVVIGGGSNIVWTDKGFEGLVIVNRIRGLSFSAEGKEIYVTIGAGEIWDNVVRQCINKDLSGIEALSLIPGSAGATPVQNVGAYGQEIADTLISVEAFDSLHQKFVTLLNKECAFAYRNSRFKTTDKHRFFIMSITLCLRRGLMKPPLYPALQRHLDAKGIKVYTPRAIRNAVVQIRRSKLPDPAKIANNGSFFANPLVERSTFVAIEAKYPGVPHWETTDGKVKISAAWLLENAGFKDLHDKTTGMATWSKQPLVLVNEAARNTDDLLAFKQKIVTKVKRKFGITLLQEPELLGD